MYLHYFNSNINMTGGGMPIPMQLAGAAVNKATEKNFSDKYGGYLLGCCIFCFCITVIMTIVQIVLTSKQSEDPSNNKLASQRNITFNLSQVSLFITVCLTASVGIMFQQQG